MDDHGRFWAGASLWIYFVSGVLLIIPMLSIPSLSWVSYQSNGSTVYMSLSSISGSLGFAWIWYVPLSGLLLFIGYFFSGSIERGKGYGWRWWWIPFLGCLVVLLAALIDVVWLAYQLDAELAHKNITFWSNIGGGWYSAATGAIFGLVAITIRTASKRLTEVEVAEPERERVVQASPSVQPQVQPQSVASSSPVQQAQQAPVQPTPIVEQKPQPWPDYSTYQPLPPVAAPPPPPSPPPQQPPGAIPPPPPSPMASPPVSQPYQEYPPTPAYDPNQAQPPIAPPQPEKKRKKLFGKNK